MKIIKLLFVTIGILFLGACKPKQNLNYLQDVEQITMDAALKNSAVTLQPGDKLVITVSAKDLDVVKPFNQNYSSGQLIQGTQQPGNVNTSSTIEGGPTYYIGQNGTIDFPILGVISTSNKNVEELTEDLTSRLRKYIKEPVVNIKLTNFKVSVMGEVNRPGEYILMDGSGTLLSALSMAGDLTIYGERNNVLIVRNVDGKLETTRLDLTQSGFLSSPYYHLKQGDAIYVSSNETKQKSSRLDPNAGIYISVASIIVTILALVFKK